MKTSFFSKTKTFLLESTEHPKKFLNILLKTLRTFMAATKKFLKDDCLTKASAISYTTIMSLIPMLTVGLTFYSIFSGMGEKKEVIFDRISQFMAEHGVRLNLSPIFEMLSTLIENAKKIGGVGAVVLIFSATAVLRTIDKSLNDIWKVKKGRAIWIQVVYYWAILTLGPILMISGGALFNKVEKAISFPAFHSVVLEETQNKYWFAGSNANLGFIDNNNKQILVQNNQISFFNQESYSFDLENQSFKKNDLHITRKELNKVELLKILFHKNHGFACGKNGILLYSPDYGDTWQIKKFGFLDLTDMAIQNSSLLLTTAQGFLIVGNVKENTWQVKNISTQGESLNSLSFYQNQGIITSQNGSVYLSTNGGQTWQNQKIEAEQTQSDADFYTALWLENNKILVAGKKGAIFLSNNGGKTWQNKSFLKRNYYTMVFKDSQKGYIAGEKGSLIYTQNGGKKWQRVPLKSNHIYSLTLQQDKILAFGEEGLNLTLEKGKRTGAIGKNFFLNLLQFLFKFFLIWLLFLLAYLFFPNTKVSFKGASLGASFTSVVWILFLFLFSIYVQSFAQGTMAIYGVLASFPLFLLLVYSSSAILLYGAQVAFVVMHPEDPLKDKDFNQESQEKVFFTLWVLQKISQHYHLGKGAYPLKKLEKLAQKHTFLLNPILENLKAKNLILASDLGFIPAKSPHQIFLFEVIEKIHDYPLNLDFINKEKGIHEPKITRLFKDLSLKRKEALAQSTLKDLFDE